ncbi:hypothetical protein AM593_08637, partial [Mytilus galloprovincialis]
MQLFCINGSDWMTATGRHVNSICDRQTTNGRPQSFICNTVTHLNHCIWYFCREPITFQGIQFELAMGNCTVKPLPFSFTSIGRKLCLPPSTKLMTSFYGSASETLDFDMYLISIHGGQMTMSLTPKGCAPISESISTEEGVFNFGFMGLTSGITDPSVFEMPQSCKNLQGTDVGQSPFIPSI